MLTFLELSISNFLGYGNVPTVVSLDKGKVVLISGTNGVGKTTIINGIYYTCCDESLSGCNADELINITNAQGLETYVIFHKSNQGYYKISRGRKTKQGNYVKFYHNPNERDFPDSTEISLDSTRNTNNLIIDVLGITSEMFKRMVIISASDTSFLDISPTQQAGFMERLFDLHILADKSTALKTSIKATEDQIKQQLFKIERIQQEQSRLDSQINNAKQKAETFDQNKESEILRYQTQLESISNIDFDAERTIFDESKTIKKDLDEVKLQYNSLSTKYTKLAQRKEKHEKELIVLKDSKCPYCEQHYQNDDKIAENEQIVADSVESINEMIEFLDSLDQEISEKDKQHKESISKLSVGSVEELINLKNKAETIHNKIEDLHKSSNVYLEQLAELEQITLEPCDYESLDKLKNIVEHQQFLLKLLSKKDSFIRKNLLSSNLTYLNVRLAHYLNDLEFPYHVEFNANMTADVKYLGRKISFSNLSNGQRSRINIAISIAFRDVRQKISSPINICCLDESLDTGLDVSGTSAAIKMLKKKSFEDSTTMFVVTHRDEVTNLFDDVMTVTMEHGFSKLNYAGV
jgi:DNA repair exonuclease SbcCD ATPase subunit